MSMLDKIFIFVIVIMVIAFAITAFNSGGSLSDYFDYVRKNKDE